MPIYRNQETGHEVEVMPGTRLPKVYKQVEKKTAPKPPTGTADKQSKPATTNKEQAGKSATAKKTAGAKTNKPTNKDDKSEKEQPAAQSKQ